jgi:membrane glycosyltransferase
MLARFGIAGMHRAVILTLFVVLMSQLVLYLFTTFLGIMAMITRARPKGLVWPDELTLVNGLNKRTAIVCPIKNEDSAHVFANTQAMYESIKEIGASHLFDTYVVSNSDDPDCWVEEEMAWHALSQETDQIFYWKRQRAMGRKTANIAEFCDRWGTSYEYMVVLDADSLLTADALISLVNLMEHNPRAGVIQLPTTFVNIRTLFARIQQFANWAHGQVAWWGDRSWQGRAGPYCGHNAIVRLAPFMANCELPRLSGRPPLGGELLSHDFVEAALLGRAGWDVWFVPEVSGSYEECPPTIIDYVRRDRRWCQGDMQNLRLLFTPGLPFVSRLRFVISALQFVSAPLFLTLLVLLWQWSTMVGGTTSVGCGTLSDAYGSCAIDYQGMLPFFIPLVVWGATRMIGLTAVLLANRGRAGGMSVLRAVFSAVLEQLISTLTAPILVFSHTRFVVEVLSGRDGGWSTQRHVSRRPCLRRTVSFHASATAIGVVMLSVVTLFAPPLLWWFAPMLVGWILSTPLSLLTGSASVGRLASRFRLFVTPHEDVLPPVVARARELRDIMRRGLPQNSATWRQVLTDPGARAMHLALLAHAVPLSANDRATAELAALKLRDGERLSAIEKLALLRDPDQFSDFQGRGTIPLSPHTAW